MPSYARHGDIFFEVLPDFRLCHVAPTLFLTYGTWHRVRVVGSKGKKHTMDPEVDMHEVTLWTLWIWEGRPLSRLSWDPGVWLWPAVVDSNPAVSFLSTLCLLAEPSFSGRITVNPLHCVRGCMQGFHMLSQGDFGDTYGGQGLVTRYPTSCG